LPGFKPERDRQIGRADVDRVDAGDGEDVVEVADGFDGLDHRDEGDAVAGPVEVVRAPHAGDDRTKATRTRRYVAAGAHHCLCFGDRVDHRHDDPSMPASSILPMMPGSFHGTRAMGVPPPRRMACAIATVC
jgi:hypothetical protein